MHELAITQSMLELVLDQAKQAGGGRVNKITLIIGEMCGYAEESVRFYFDFLSKGTPAEKAELVFNKVKAQARCRACRRTFKIKEFDWVCPHCSELSLEIICGKELKVESIEVEDEDKGTEGHTGRQRAARPKKPRAA